MKEFSYERSPEIEKKLMIYVFRDMIKKQFIIFISITIFSILFHLLIRGRKDWTFFIVLCIGTVGTMAAVFLIAYAVMYAILKNAATRLWKGADDRTVNVQITDEKIHMATQVSAYEIPWNRIKKITRAEGFMFFWVAPLKRCSIPVSFVDAELEQLLKEVRARYFIEQD
jgi:hypothetical protein